MVLTAAQRISLVTSNSGLVLVFPVLSITSFLGWILSLLLSELGAATNLQKGYPKRASEVTFRNPHTRPFHTAQLSTVPHLRKLYAQTHTLIEHPRRRRKHAHRPIFYGSKDNTPQIPPAELRQRRCGGTVHYAYKNAIHNP